MPIVLQEPHLYQQRGVRGPEERLEDMAAHTSLRTTAESPRTVPGGRRFIPQFSLLDERHLRKRPANLFLGISPRTENRVRPA